MFDPFYRSCVTVFNRVGNAWQATVISRVALSKKSTVEDNIVKVSGKVWISPNNSRCDRVFAVESDRDALTDTQKQGYYFLDSGVDLICEGSHTDYADNPLDHCDCAPIKSAVFMRNDLGLFITVEY